MESPEQPESHDPIGVCPLCRREIFIPYCEHNRLECKEVKRMTFTESICREMSDAELDEAGARMTDHIRAAESVGDQVGVDVWIAEKAVLNREKRDRNRDAALRQIA